MAIARVESEAERCLDRIVNALDRRISTGNMLEAYLVVDGSGDPVVRAEPDKTVSDVQLEVTPVDRDQVEIARDAFWRFGKGGGHPARLNYGDCFAYALARFMDEPLLFVGNDVAHTDIASAL